MLCYLKKYPVSLLILAAILYLSFFTPPETDAAKIPYIDKVAHVCMYGGLCLFIWIEYLRSHQAVSRCRVLVGAYLLPIMLSGAIECLQAFCTTNRGGEWLDLAANVFGVLSAAFIGEFILRPWIQKK